jgi:hypothetical protein
MKSRRLKVPLLAALSLAFAAPALAHPDQAAMPDQRPEWPGEQAAAPHPGYDRAAYEQARADWLAECRANRSSSGKTVGGVVLGGLVGGVIGNRVAGRGTTPPTVLPLLLRLARQPHCRHGGRRCRWGSSGRGHRQCCRPARDSRLLRGLP